jgi:Icc-related predicted phosphoesterase
MIIDCISDLHGHYPKLEGGDLLIVAGDLTARDTALDHMQFQVWLHDQKYKKKVIIAGNHDNRLQQIPFEGIQRQYREMGEDYLCDSGTEFHGTKSNGEVCTMKLWGTPWTAQFPGINPKCCAFTENYGCDTDYWLEEHWNFIPDDIDILITHCPPYDILDETFDGKKVGSKTLLAKSLKVAPKLHVFGHIHEEGGKQFIFKRLGHGDENNTIYVNASHVNERYKPVNKPVRILL